MISGMPFAILYTALVTWVTEGGHILSVVTTLAAARLPYSFKYVWAPIIDRLKVPVLGSMGRRKSWMILTCLISAIVLILFSQINAKESFKLIYILACILGFVSATYDIVFDAFRIDSVEPEKQGYAVSCSTLGYRIGMLIVSSGSLTVAHFYGWSFAFLMLAGTFILATFYIPFLKEPFYEEKKNQTLKEKIIESVINPFLDFFGRKNALLILLAIVIYKAGGVLLGFVSTPFYLKLGYTKLDIGIVIKAFGFWATFVGIFFGSLIISRIGNLRALIVCGLIQACVHLIFIWLHYSDHSWYSLLIAITVENIGSGCGTVAELAYLSALCNRSYSATQYALLSSFAVMLNSTISIKAGTMVEYLGWDDFFISTAILSLPALVIFAYIDRKESKALKA